MRLFALPLYPVADLRGSREPAAQTTAHNHHRDHQCGKNAIGHSDGTLQSLLTVPVTAGVTYRIRVGGFGASRGNAGLQVAVNQRPTTWSRTRR
jgi:hypothetical protein